MKALSATVLLALLGAIQLSAYAAPLVHPTDLSCTVQADDDKDKDKDKKDG
jgi:hypothetical protein